MGFIWEVSLAPSRVAQKPRVWHPERPWWGLQRQGRRFGLGGGDTALPAQEPLPRCVWQEDCPRLGRGGGALGGATGDRRGSELAKAPPTRRGSGLGELGPWFQ